MVLIRLGLQSYRLHCIVGQGSGMRSLPGGQGCCTWKGAETAQTSFEYCRNMYWVRFARSRALPSSEIGRGNAISPEGALQPMQRCTETNQLPYEELRDTHELLLAKFERRSFQRGSPYHLIRGTEVAPAQDRPRGSSCVGSAHKRLARISVH